VVRRATHVVASRGRHATSSPAGFFYRGAAITDDAVGLGRGQHTVMFAIAGVLAHRFGRAGNK
jgi:hypothetical protein